MIPPLLLGRTRQVSAPVPLLDRVFPPEACDFAFGDLWASSGRSGLAYGAWRGDAYTKRTCLWTGGGFVMPPPRPVEPVLGSMMHRLPPTADRGDLRSVTPAGFARAVFEANEHGVEPAPPVPGSLFEVLA